MRTKLALLTAALMALAACQTAPQRNRALEPSAEDMRSALKSMLAEHPDIAIPEFHDWLDNSRAVERKGIVFIGEWNCDPRLASFETVFTAPNVSLYEVSGRFERDARGIWRAYPRIVRSTTSQDVGEFWRSSEVDAARIGI